MIVATFLLSFIGIYSLCCFFFFFNDTATTEIYTLSLHDALPILPLDGTGVHPAGIVLGGVLAPLLRAVHRDIRVLQQGPQILAVDRRDADADARRDLEFLAVHRHRLRHLDEDLLR